MRDLVVLTVLAACAGGAAPAPPHTAAAPTQRAPLLTIRPLTFIDDGKPRIRLAANGGIEVVVHHVFDRNSTLENRFAGTLAADGSFADGHGTIAGTLHADGTFTTAGDAVVPFQLVGDTLVVGDKHLVIDDTGMLLENGHAATIRIDGAVDPATRRTALVVFAIANSVSLRDRHPFCDHVRDAVNRLAPAIAEGTKLAIDREDQPIVAPDRELAGKLRHAADTLVAAIRDIDRTFGDEAIDAFDRDLVAVLRNYAGTLTRLAEASDRGDRPAWDSAIAQEKTARGKIGELGRTIIERTQDTCKR
jgi:hypothetical protein